MPGHRESSASICPEDRPLRRDLLFLLLTGQPDHGRPIFRWITRWTGKPAAPPRQERIRGPFSGWPAEGPQVPPFPHFPCRYSAPAALLRTLPWKRAKRPSLEVLRHRLALARRLAGSLKNGSWRREPPMGEGHATYFSAPNSPGETLLSTSSKSRSTAGRFPVRLTPRSRRA